MTELETGESDVKLKPWNTHSLNLNWAQMAREGIGQEPQVIGVQMVLLILIEWCYRTDHSTEILNQIMPRGSTCVLLSDITHIVPVLHVHSAIVFLLFCFLNVPFTNL